MQFDAYLSNLPLLHTWDDGRTWNSGGFEPDQLRVLHDFLKDRLAAPPTIVETGAGNTTITLAFLAPARHDVICPDPGVLQRVRNFCEAAELPLAHLAIHTGFSEWILPELARPYQTQGPDRDFGLIDGGHNWPTVFVDFFYINAMLRQGGYLMIDDLQLHSVKELGRLLSEEPGFALECDLGKSLIFRKLTPARQLAEWNDSPYIKRITAQYMTSANPFALYPPPSAPPQAPVADAADRK